MNQHLSGEVVVVEDRAVDVGVNVEFLKPSTLSIFLS